MVLLSVPVLVRSRRSREKTVESSFRSPLPGFTNGAVGTGKDFYQQKRNCMERLAPRDAWSANQLPMEQTASECDAGVN